MEKETKEMAAHGRAMDAAVNESKVTRARFIRKQASLQYGKINEANALIKKACEALEELQPDAPDEWLDRAKRSQ